MRTIKVTVRAVELSREMIAMRRWLDHDRYEVTRFDCDGDGEHVVVSVDLTSDTAAEAFASRFDGENNRSSPRPAGDGQRQPSTKAPNVSPATDHLTSGSPVPLPPPD